MKKTDLHQMKPDMDQEETDLIHDVYGFNRLKIMG